MSGVTKALWALTAASLATALAAVLWFTLATMAARVPYWGEAEVLFEARRIHEGLPLFVDPLVGAHDMGEPPSRWYVTYPPIWSAVVSLVPTSAGMIVARVASTIAWLGALLGIAATSRRDARLNAIACAAFVAGSWILANFATVGRPDSIACALAAAGLVRAIKKGRIDGVSAILLVLVPWVKPTVLGLSFGAFAVDLARRRKQALSALAIAAGAFAVIALVMVVASGGAIFANVARSNAQPMTFAAWLDHVPPRLPFFTPLFALAAWLGWRDRESGGSAIGLGALGVSLVWVLVALAKTGSSSNYWMEPCVGAVALVAHARPRSFRFGASGTLHAALALVVVVYAGVASVRSSFEHATGYRDDAAFVATLRERCNGVIAADEAGVELALDGRILTPTYQMVYVVLADRYPASKWISDLSSVSCVVEHTGQYRLSPDLARFLDEHFVLTAESRGYRVLGLAPITSPGR